MRVGIRSVSPQAVRRACRSRQYVAVKARKPEMLQVAASHAQPLPRERTRHQRLWGEARGAAKVCIASLWKLLSRAPCRMRTQAIVCEYAAKSCVLSFRPPLIPGKPVSDQAPYQIRKTTRHVCSQTCNHYHVKLIRYWKTVIFPSFPLILIINLFFDHKL
jgi:hypothetical protein